MGVNPERWHAMTFVEQMGNIGSEVGRALRGHANQMPDRKHRALARALELFALTLSDPKLGEHRDEVLRTRDQVVDFLDGDNLLGSTAEAIDEYFIEYGIAANQLRAARRAGGAAQNETS